MDPLSITASIVAVVGAAMQTSKASGALYNLRNAPEEILELTNEVSELQALLCLVQKAIGNASQSTLPSEDQEFIKRLIESAREPLNQLDNLITTCSCNADASSAEQGTRLSISFTTWLKSRNSVKKIRKRFLRAHRNISTALAALSSIDRQEDNRLILKIHDLVLTQTKETDTNEKTEKDELALCHQFSRAVLEQIYETVPRSDNTILSRRRSSSVAAQSGNLDPSFSTQSGGKRWRAVEKEGQLPEDYGNNTDPLESPASIHALISKGTCDWSCRCQCHPRRGMESPRWLTQLLGTLFYSHTGTPLLRLRPCNYPACIQRETASCQLTYHFPRWMMRRVFMFTASYRDLGGISASWSIGFPRTISASHKAWECIERSQSREFLQLLRDGVISGNDNADDDGTSLLIFALKFRSHEIVGLLLDYNANPHLVDPRGISACAYAQSSLLIDRPSQRPLWLTQMDLTIDEPSVTDDLHFTPLHHIVIGLEKADLRQQLRISKIDINTPDSFGRSLLHWAVIMGNSGAVEALLLHGIFPTSVDREQMTPLHNIFLSPPSSQVLCARLLLDAGAEVDALDAWGRTPFRIAVGYSNISLDLLKMLINNGANVNHKDIYSQSPLLKSISGRVETIQLLLSHGADIEARDGYGNTPVLDAIYRDIPEKLQMLLEHGAKTNEDFELKPGRRARDGPASLLDFIVWHGSVEIMRILEHSAKQQYHLSHPIDTFEQFRDFRLVNGRKAGDEEREALAHMLSKMEISYETNLPPDCLEIKSQDDGNYCDDEKYCDDEIFVDAQDSLLEQV